MAPVGRVVVAGRVATAPALLLMASGIVATVNGIVLMTVALNPVDSRRIYVPGGTVLVVTRDARKGYCSFPGVSGYVY